MNAQRAAIIAATLAALLTGCAHDSASRANESAPQEATVDWNNPIGGEPVKDTVEANSALGFEVLVPDGFGAPAGIYVIPKSDSDAGAVDLVYDLDIGRVVVAEFPWDFPTDQWKGWVDSVVAESSATPSVGADGTTGPVVLGSAESYPLPGGRLGLITTSDDGKQSDIRWLETSGLEMVIQGPDLSRDAVVGLAETLAKQAAS